MKISNHIDPARCFQLLSGVAGIYLSYLITGLLHQPMIKSKYVNDFTGVQQQFNFVSAFMIFPCGITWLIGALVNRFTIKPEDRVSIPAKKAAICGLTVAISTFTYTYAIILTNFPVVMMFKSCNVLSVILVGVLCSRVKNKKLKLGTKKIVIGLLITAGIIVFKVADPALKDSQNKTQIFGVILLLVSLLADGFLPDFQASIKSDYSPAPMQMMAEINKWVTILSFLYACIVQTLFMDVSIVDMFIFLGSHRWFLLQMVLMGTLSTIGQMFVYRMIKQFKQHFVPFVITSRKIFTVALSIIFYQHATNLWQMAGIVMVFSVVAYEFVTQLMAEKKEEHGEEQAQKEGSEKTNQLSSDVRAEEITSSGGENLESSVEQKRKRKKMAELEKDGYKIFNESQ